MRNAVHFSTRIWPLYTQTYRFALKAIPFRNASPLRTKDPFVSRISKVEDS